jgi:hypothetical protein
MSDWELDDEVRRLPREEAPPPELEARIAAKLPRTQSRVRTFALAALFALAFFALGFLFGQRPASAAPASPQFVLLLRESPDTQHGNRVAEYTAWARSIARTGNLTGGAKLSDEGRILQGANADVLREAEVGGYFIIAAENIEAAQRIAATCPHLKYGGTIELRPIDR